MSTEPTHRYSIAVTSLMNEALLKAAEAEGMEPAPFIQRAVIDRLIPFLSKPEADRLHLFQYLADRAAELARRLCREGKFSPDITLITIAELKKDEKWMDAYTKYVDGKTYNTGVPEKGPINREIGWRIRGAINAKVNLKDGKPVMKKVLGDIIQSYTVMSGYDEAKYGPNSG